MKHLRPSPSLPLLFLLPGALLFFAGTSAPVIWLGALLSGLGALALGALFYQGKKR